MIERLCIVGVGLIGGSLSRALRQREAVQSVVGCSRNEEHLKKAVQLGVIDEYSTDLAQAVQGADLIILAVPLQAFPQLLPVIRDHMAPYAVLTDVGSAKQSVIDAAESIWGEMPARFIPGHPIAGTEHSGVEHSFAELFTNRRVILTPHANANQDALELVKNCWQVAGADVVCMNARRHDRVLAATSHVPHVLAFALVHSLAHMDGEDDVFAYAAGGFRDFSRIASSDPVMWRDICLTNAEAVLQTLDQFEADLGQLRQAITDGDGQLIEQYFSRAKSARDTFVMQ